MKKLTAGQLATRGALVRRVNLARSAGEETDGGFAPVRRFASANRLDLGQMAQIIAAVTAREAAQWAAKKEDLRAHFAR